MSVFMQRIYGSWAGRAVTGLIMWTAFASVFSLLLGYSRVPYAAALDGNYFRAFARVHPQHRFPTVSLLALGGVAMLFCLLRLADVIAALVVIRISAAVHRAGGWADGLAHAPTRRAAAVPHVALSRARACWRLPDSSSFWWRGKTFCAKSATQSSFLSLAWRFTSCARGGAASGLSRPTRQAWRSRMSPHRSTQLVTVCQRLATSASESGRNRLTFSPPCGQNVDGHERSMAGTDCAPSCPPGDGRGG